MNALGLHPIELPTPLPVGPITVYVAAAPGEPLTLIDTGPHTQEARAALQASLNALGYTITDLGRIVISHAHVDHFGQAAALVAASGAQVYSHPWNIATLQEHDPDQDKRTAFYKAFLRQAGAPEDAAVAVRQATRRLRGYGRPVAVDVSLNEGDTLRLAGRDWQVLHTPGHAVGLICLHDPISRTLLSSDHLLATISSNPVVEPPVSGENERPRSLALYCAALQRVAAMDIVLALPGHGPSIHDVSGLVSQRLAFHQRREEQVLACIRRGIATTWDIGQALFPNCTNVDAFLALSEVIGHLDLLEMDGRAIGENRNGVLFWTLAGE
jgi:glyoxylase-like metal-dependent hydrolase (beta-lactamase superfamily II)